MQVQWNQATSNSTFIKSTDKTINCIIYVIIFIYIYNNTCHTLMQITIKKCQEV